MLFRGYLEFNIAGILSFVHYLHIKPTQFVVIIKTSEIRNVISYIQKYFENYVHNGYTLSELNRKIRFNILWQLLYSLSNNVCSLQPGVDLAIVF
jgi:hypothetical protein